jgi:hypothetical protein
MWELTPIDRQRSEADQCFRPSSPTVPAVLILSQYQDSHAIAVERVLRRKGAEVVLWRTSDYPSQDVESLQIGGGLLSFKLDGLQGSSRFRSVWNRRPHYVIDHDLLDPADHEFADLNCREFRKALWDLFLPDAFWVNPHAAARSLTKPLQFARAQELGFTVPDTCVTNDPQEIRSFFAQHPEGVIFKPLTSLSWKDSETYWMPYTARLLSEHLSSDDALRAAPGIYQALVPKKIELRATVMGRCALTAQIHSQQTQTGKLDWRQAYGELTMKEGALPADVLRKCRTLLRRLGLVFGCFDFIVTPDDQIVFLEVNQMGQFLFLEHYTELPLLDAFAEFLLSGDRDFSWKPGKRVIRYRDVEDEVCQALSDEVGRHVEPPEVVWRESPQS